MEQIGVPLIDVESGEMLACHFAGSEVFRIERLQARGLVKLIKRLVEILLLFKLEAALEGVPGRFAVFGR